MTDYNIQKATIIRYLLLKVDTEDWHAVADAAMDLRELDILIKLERLNSSSLKSQAGKIILDEDIQNSYIIVDKKDIKPKF